MEKAWRVARITRPTVIDRIDEFFTDPGTARDMAKLAQLLLDGKLISRPTLKLLNENLIVTKDIVTGAHAERGRGTTVMHLHKNGVSITCRPFHSDCAVHSTHNRNRYRVLWILVNSRISFVRSWAQIHERTSGLRNPANALDTVRSPKPCLIARCGRPTINPD
ncbi:unnamed protein product [Nippostrongylus brasiliensis]|uniref:H15 domain-containing protein n=1 Tax=Nippostrongylus brasiliensis TaxID=27835 RepID=A0A0N4XRG1_NIPBR|nr:unnamed protein product [Nippostrongylus brasiliensis]